MFHVAIDPKAPLIATGSLHGVVRAVSSETGESITHPLRHIGFVQAIALNPKFKVIAAGGREYARPYYGISRPRPNWVWRCLSTKI